MNISESGRVWLAPANFNYWTGTGRMFHGGSRRIVIDMSFLWRSLSASDLIKVLFSDFYSPSHSSPTPPWLQAAALIEYIASQATAADRKLWASHLSCHQFPSCIFVVRFTSPPFKILGKVLFCLVSSFLEPFSPSSQWVDVLLLKSPVYLEPLFSAFWWLKSDSNVIRLMLCSFQCHGHTGLGNGCSSNHFQWKSVNAHTHIYIYCIFAFKTLAFFWAPHTQLDGYKRES